MAAVRDHYDDAQQYLKAAAGAEDCADRGYFVGVAQVHALLAVAAASLPDPNSVDRWVELFPDDLATVLDGRSQLTLVEVVARLGLVDRAAYGAWTFADLRSALDHHGLPTAQWRSRTVVRSQDVERVRRAGAGGAQ